MLCHLDQQSLSHRSRNTIFNRLLIITLRKATYISTPYILDLYVLAVEEIIPYFAGTKCIARQSIYHSPKI